VVIYVTRTEAGFEVSIAKDSPFEWIAESAREENVPQLGAGSEADGH
jgi:hypothetical protein